MPTRRKKTPLFLMEFIASAAADTQVMCWQRCLDACARGALTREPQAPCSLSLALFASSGSPHRSGSQGAGLGLLPLPRSLLPHSPVHSTAPPRRAGGTGPHEPQNFPCEFIPKASGPNTRERGCASQPVIQTSINFLKIQGLRLPKPAQPFTRVRTRVPDDPGCSEVLPRRPQEAGPGCAQQGSSGSPASSPAPGARGHPDTQTSAPARSAHLFTSDSQVR